MIEDIEYNEWTYWTKVVEAKCLKEQKTEDDYLAAGNKLMSVERDQQRGTNFDVFRDDPFVFLRA